MWGAPSTQAAWIRGCSQLRQRWRSWLILVLLLGAAGGLLIGAAAGARRSASVYDRLSAESGALDYAFCAIPEESQFSCSDDVETVEEAIARRDEAENTIREVLRLPEIAEGTVLTTMLVPVFTDDGRTLQPSESGGDSCFTGSGEVDVDGFETRGGDIHRPVYVSGRAPDPSRRREVAVSRGVADRLGIGVGDTLRVVPVSACDAPKREWPDPIEVRVVGTQITPIEVEPESGFFLQSVAVTPPLLDDLKAAGLGMPYGVVRLGPDVSRREFLAAAGDMGARVEIAIVGAEFEAGVEDGLRPDTTTLWAFVVLGLAATVVVMGQAVARQMRADASDIHVLRGIGFTTRDFAAVGAVLGGVMGVASAVLASALASAGSFVTPLGRARAVEPDPGFRFDPAVVLGGAALIFIGCIVAVVAASGLSARRIWSAQDARTRPSVVDAWVGRARLSPPAAYGVRMALEPGRGASAAPVRSGFAGLIVALALLIGSVTFVAGLDHLESTPRLVGLNWDVTFFGEFEDPDPDPDPDLDRGAQVAAALDHARRNDGIARIGGATWFPQFAESNVLLREVPEAQIMAFDAGPRAIGPSVTSGRAPSAADEVLLTRDALRRGGFAIGDVIALHGDDTAKFRIVGVGVLPIGDGRIDSGVSVTLEGLRRIKPDAAPDVVVADFAPGADRSDVTAALAELGFRRPMMSSDLDHFELVDLDVRPAETTPRLIAALMAVLAAGIFLHLIVTVSRARRHELSILRAFGFTSRQVQRSAAWQAATVSMVAGIAAAAVGVLGGRALWRVYAARLDIVAEPAQSWTMTAAVVLSGFVYCSVLAWLVTRPVARTDPGAYLRVE